VSPPLLAAALACALLSLATWLRDREHGPVALALVFSAARDAAGPLLRGEPAIDAALLCAAACLSGRSYALAWGWGSALVADVAWGWAALMFAIVATVGGASDAPVVAYVASTITGCLAFNGWDGERTATTDTALVLLAGDAAGLAFGWRDDAVPRQAALQLVAAAIVQAAWLARRNE
jgi:hypothetical protein